jgi:folate-binding protein YgfZ
MPQNLAGFLTALGSREPVEHLGDLSGVLAAAQHGTVLVPLSDQGLIRASGPEAAEFLHNLLTNDVKNLADDAVRFAGLCTAKGRLIATFLIWHEGADRVLQLSADLLAGILKKLSMYILRSKVTLSDASGERHLVGLAGSKAPRLLQSLGVPVPEPMRTAGFADGLVIALDSNRFILSLLPAEADRVCRVLAEDARPAGTAAWRWLEIAAGQPRIVAATQDAFVPQMVNLELPTVAGVSFTKGCYPGQEIVARTQYLGKIKRRMYRARMETSFPPGTDVFTPEAGDQHCGALAMVAPSPEGGYECLVVVQSSGAEAGEIHVGGPQGPRLTLQPLPYPLD